MNKFDALNFLFNMMWAVTALVIPIYISIRLTLKFSYYRELDAKMSYIRSKVILSWQANLKSFNELVNNVPVEQLRVIGKRDAAEHKRFRLIQLAFYLFSAIVFISGLLCKSIPSSVFDSKPVLVYVLLGNCLIYIIVLSQLIHANYYEYAYYRTLDELNRKAEEDIPQALDVKDA